MNRDEMVNRILALSPQRGLRGDDAGAYAGVDASELKKLLEGLENISASGHELSKQQKVHQSGLEAQIAAVRARRDQGVARLVDKLAVLSAKLPATAGADQGIHDPDPDLSLQELLHMREELERLIEARRSRERQTVLARIRGLIDEYGITMADLKFRRTSAGAKQHR